MKSKWYPLLDINKEKLTKYINDVKTVLKNEPTTIQTVLKKILSSRTNSNVADELNQWVYKTYDNTLSIGDYNKLLAAVGVTCLLLQAHPEVMACEYIDTSYFDKKSINICGDFIAALQDSMTHEFVVLSQLPVEEIKSLGEIYENFI